MENATYTPARTESPTRANGHRSDHARWCDPPGHNLAQEGEPACSVGCVGRPIERGNVGGWISANTGEPTGAVVVDWQPATDGQLTFAEARDMHAFLRAALVEAGEL